MPQHFPREHIPIAHSVEHVLQMIVGDGGGSGVAMGDLTVQRGIQQIFISFDINVHQILIHQNYGQGEIGVVDVAVRSSEGFGQLVIVYGHIGREVAGVAEDTTGVDPCPWRDCRFQSGYGSRLHRLNPALMKSYTTILRFYPANPFFSILRRSQ